MLRLPKKFKNKFQISITCRMCPVLSTYEIQQSTASLSLSFMFRTTQQLCLIPWVICYIAKGELKLNPAYVPQAQAQALSAIGLHT